MIESNTLPVSNDFKKLCEFIAISDAVDNQEVLLRLIESTLLGEALLGLTAEEIRNQLSLRFSIDESVDCLQISIDRLDRNKRIIRHGERYKIVESRRDTLCESLKEIEKIEGKVKKAWHSEVESLYGKIDLNLLWTCLTDFLAKAIRLHGLETISFLHPSSIKNGELNKPLLKVLKDCATTYSINDEEGILKDAIHAFFIGAQSSNDRAKLICQLSSSAFNYYSLRIPPEISSKLKDGLRPLTLFLDTNFIICYLGLDTPEKVNSARELIKLIKDHKLPFKLRYHHATADEISRIFIAKKNYLRRHSWTRALSSAATKTNSINGIEFAFHKKNLNSNITAEHFFLPLDDFRNTLKFEDIEIYNCPHDLFKERAEIEHEYKAHLKYSNRINRREKEEPAINHDCAVLATVYNIREGATSILDTKSLLLSIDQGLYWWEARYAQKHKKIHGVILPHQLVQLLKPFCQSHLNYDMNFVSAISMPEFRIGGDVYQKAQANTISILSSFENINERQATEILSNRVLVQSISDAPSNDEKVKLIQLELSRSEENAINIASEKTIEANKLKKIADDARAIAETQINEAALSKSSKELAEKGLISKQRKLDNSTPNSVVTERVAKLHTVIRFLVIVIAIILIAVFWKDILTQLNLFSSWNEFYSLPFHLAVWSTGIFACLAIVFPKRWVVHITLAATSFLTALTLMLK